MQRQKIGILGATGMVGQRFIQLLERHPWFEVAWLAASDKSSGKRYGDAVKWKLDTALPAHIAEMRVSPATPAGAPKIIFAALDSDIAREMEPAFAAAGCAVISNSSAFRMQEDVPLVIPEVNASHLPLLENQSWRKQSGGYIVTNPNCSAIGLVLALKPLEERFGIDSIFVSTMQAVSGAGYPGVASLDILGNVVPYIKSEEEKMQEETLKLLGSLKGARVQPLDAKVSAHCNRVPVEDGHTESVSIKLRRPATREEILAAWSEFKPLAGQDLPTAPAQPVEFVAADDRPQPRLDRMRGNGMASTVGRLRPCPLLDWKFTVLSHNTIRGAAGWYRSVNSNRWRSRHEEARRHEVRRDFRRRCCRHSPYCGNCRRTAYKRTAADCRGQCDGQGDRPAAGCGQCGFA
jgi:aspartate-semialdehyde dehydrogenase